MALVQSFHEGGIFMWFILGFAVFSLTLILERGVFLFMSVKEFSAGGFRKQLLDFIAKGDLKAAEAHSQGLTQDKSLGGLARIVSTGISLRASGSGDEELQARMDEKLSQEISRIDRRTGFLAMFGNVATLLGLLGTIVGMIHSFAAVATANPADRATLLSKGISEAMNCTAFGLIVAIPALVAFAIYQNRTDRLITALTEATSQIYHDLLFFTEATGILPAGLKKQIASSGVMMGATPAAGVQTNGLQVQGNA